MKAVFLSYNQALTDRVNAILDEQGIRGFTRWALTEGRGSVDGEPHYGTHAWPSMNASIMAIVDDEKVAPLMAAFREMDAATKLQGLAGLRLEYRADLLIAGRSARCPEMQKSRRKNPAGFFRCRRLFPPRGVWCYAPPFLRPTLRPSFLSVFRFLLGNVSPAFPC